MNPILTIYRKLNQLFNSKFCWVFYMIVKILSNVVVYLDQQTRYVQSVNWSKYVVAAFLPFPSFWKFSDCGIYMLRTYVSMCLLWSKNNAFKLYLIWINSKPIIWDSSVIKVHYLYDSTFKMAYKHHKNKLIQCDMSTFIYYTNSLTNSCPAPVCRSKYTDILLAKLGIILKPWIFMIKK